MHIAELSKAELDGERDKFTHYSLLSAWRMYDDKLNVLSTMYKAKYRRGGGIHYFALCGYTHKSPYVVTIEKDEECMPEWKRLVRNVLRTDIRKMENLISELTVEITAQQIRADS